MAMRSRTSRSGEVGSGKPPVHTGFRKGSPDSRGGRPRQPANGRVKALPLGEACRGVTIKEGGGRATLPRSQLGPCVKGPRMPLKWKENARLRARTAETIPCFAPNIPCFSAEQGTPAKALISFGYRAESGAFGAKIGRKTQKFPVIFAVLRECTASDRTLK
jgi:hypothetical protein